MQSNDSNSWAWVPARRFWPVTFTTSLREVSNLGAGSTKPTTILYCGQEVREAYTSVMADIIESPALSAACITPLRRCNNTYNAAPTPNYNSIA
jgi:hypothetical protein